MITYLGKPLTPREEVDYINAVLRSVVELSREIDRILDLQWPVGEMAGRFEQITILNRVVGAEWDLWLRLYDQGQKYAWPVLPKTMSDFT